MAEPTSDGWVTQLGATLEAAGDLRQTMIGLAIDGLGASAAMLDAVSTMNGHSRDHAGAVVEAAHKLANTCAALRLSAPLDGARRIEERARRGDTAAAIGVWESMRDVIIEICDHLEERRA